MTFKAKIVSVKDVTSLKKKNIFIFFIKFAIKVLLLFTVQVPEILNILLDTSRALSSSNRLGFLTKIRKLLQSTLIIRFQHLVRKRTNLKSEVIWPPILGVKIEVGKFENLTFLDSFSCWMAQNDRNRI